MSWRTLLRLMIGFHSLPTGKCIASKASFPAITKRIECFNSLQMGNSIARAPPRLPYHTCWDRMRFCERGFLPIPITTRWATRFFRYAFGHKTNFTRDTMGCQVLFFIPCSPAIRALHVVINGCPRFQSHDAERRSRSPDPGGQLHMGNGGVLWLMLSAIPSEPLA